MKVKSFEDLIEEVHKKGICQQCGGCVSFCNSMDYDVIGYKEPNYPPEFINEENCLKCGICYHICPQTHVLDHDLNKSFNLLDFSSMPLGNTSDIYSCQSIDYDLLHQGTDGGVVNSLLSYMFQENLIDGAIVAKTTAPFSREPFFAECKDDLVGTSGLKLGISQQLDEVQKCHSYSSSLPELNKHKFKKLAVVGTPCQIYTIRSMQNLGIIPSHNIEYCLGLFCYENFEFDQRKVERFEREFNIKFEDIEKINIKKDLIIQLKGDKNRDSLIHIHFEDLKDYIRPACNACSDFTNVYADVSFGGLGSPEKFTTVITRTEKGRLLINNALKSGIISNLDLDSEAEKHMKDLLIGYSVSKMARKESFMKIKFGSLKKVKTYSL
ncbi:MAG: Coenzyme F420 hydrogenase/dehydrogenase, beta subunit C-terminal domain [Candidatus Lokiarchaeota archaeon]|nr:Coenzyme F420 hydrogenase/dehydrogenase, beta subunit C-terminal domain [Candidatus Lokiarchaeota archaeon]